MSVVESPPSALLALAPELLELVLSFLGPYDVVNFGKTCHLAHAFIAPRNQILWRSVFLHVFDHPKDAWDPLLPTARTESRHRESTWDWFRELHRRLNSFHAVCQTDNTILLVDPEHVIAPLLDVLETASLSTTRVSLNVEFLTRLFRVAPNPEKIVHDYHRDIMSLSLPFDSMADRNRPVTRSMVGQRGTVPEWASRFHIFYGMTQREVESVQAKACARAIVYDWLVTGPESEYGPMIKDKSGTVNWLALEAITSLMNRVFEVLRKDHGLGSPTGFRHCIPKAFNSLYPGDWAGVTRVWVGTYAFLDYRALVHYNFAQTMEFHMDLGEYEEACGDLMRLELNLSTFEELLQDRRLQTNLPYCQDLPMLYFKGTSNRGLASTGRPSIIVRGCVCLTPSARQVRWRFIINYSGADQWQLEGIQPAGIRSGGIYGLWSHVDHDDHGPMGQCKVPSLLMQLLTPLPGPFSYFPLEFCGPETT